MGCKKRSLSQLQPNPRMLDPIDGTHLTVYPSHCILLTSCQAFFRKSAPSAAPKPRPLPNSHGSKSAQRSHTQLKEDPQHPEVCLEGHQRLPGIALLRFDRPFDKLADHVPFLRTSSSQGRQHLTVEQIDGFEEWGPSSSPSHPECRWRTSAKSTSACCKPWQRNIELSLESSDKRQSIGSQAASTTHHNENRISHHKLLPSAFRIRIAHSKLSTRTKKPVYNVNRFNRHSRLSLTLHAVIWARRSA